MGEDFVHNFTNNNIYIERMCWNSGIIVTKYVARYQFISYFPIVRSLWHDHWPVATHIRAMFKKFLASNHEFTTATLEVESFDSNGMLYLFCLKQLKFYLPKMIYSVLFIVVCTDNCEQQKKKQVYDKRTAR